MTTATASRRKWYAVRLVNGKILVKPYDPDSHGADQRNPHILDVSEPVTAATREEAYDKAKTTL